MDFAQFPPWEQLLKCNDSARKTAACQPGNYVILFKKISNSIYKCSCCSNLNYFDDLSYEASIDTYQAVDNTCKKRALRHKTIDEYSLKSYVLQTGISGHSHAMEYFETNNDQANLDL